MPLRWTRLLAGRVLGSPSASINSSQQRRVAIPRVSSFFFPLFFFPLFLVHHSLYLSPLSIPVNPPEYCSSLNNSVGILHGSVHALILYIYRNAVCVSSAQNV